MHIRSYTLHGSSVSAPDLGSLLMSTSERILITRVAQNKYHSTMVYSCYWLVKNAVGETSSQCLHNKLRCYSSSYMLCTLHTLFHQLDITVPHNTAGSKMPLQLAEILGEASQLLGLRSTPSRAPAYMAATRTHRNSRGNWHTHMELYTS